MPKIINAPSQRVSMQNESHTLTPDLGGETIANAEWSSLEGDLIISGESHSSTQASAHIKGNTLGVAYAVCLITTSTGRVVPFVVKIPIISLTEE